jgi:hypothetical protein
MAWCSVTLQYSSTAPRVTKSTPCCCRAPADSRAAEGDGPSTCSPPRYERCCSTARSRSAAPPGWSPTVGALARLKPGLGARSGLCAGEVATVVRVEEDVAVADLRSAAAEREKEGGAGGGVELKRHRDGEELAALDPPDVVHAFEGWLPLHAAAALALSATALAVFLAAHPDAAATCDGDGLTPFELLPTGHEAAVSLFDAQKEDAAASLNGDRGDQAGVSSSMFGAWDAAAPDDGSDRDSPSKAASSGFLLSGGADADGAHDGTISVHSSSDTWVLAGNLTSPSKPPPNADESWGLSGVMTTAPATPPTQQKINVVFAN